MPASSARRRRIWPLVLPIAIVLVLAGGWTAFWFSATAQARAALAAWSAREEQAGRHYNCASQSIAGFPFRFEAVCEGATADLSSNKPPVRLIAARVHIDAQLFDPTVLTATVEGPLRVAVAGAPPSRATWTRAQIRLRGGPWAPGRMSLAIDDLAIAQGPADTPLLSAKGAEVQARIVSGTVEHDPVVELSMALTGVAAPAIHPIMAQPLNLSSSIVVSGLDNLRPMPLPARLRQLEAAGGELKLVDSRIQQGDAVATAGGAVRLKKGGRLDGELQVTAAGFDRVVSQLGLDKLLSAGQAQQVAPALGMLDSFMPGLGRLVRDNAGIGVAAGLALIGKPAQLDGRPATAFPLRITDGAVFVGPLHVGDLPPLD